MAMRPAAQQKKHEFSLDLVLNPSLQLLLMAPTTMMYAASANADSKTP